MGILELFLLAVGLSMDAFAVSICKGLAIRKITVKHCLICGIWFGAFQALMPLVGYLIGSRFEKWISLVAPWVAFFLLSILGINMIREAFSEDEETKTELDIKTMFLLAVATSIDALAVGITFVAVPVSILEAGKFQNTLFAVLLIGITTFIISSIGVKIGSLFGTRYKSGSEVMGGTILIFIGLHSLLDSFGAFGILNDSDILFGMLVPLLGTVLGSAFIYSQKKALSCKVRTVLAGISSGIMFSISVWGMLEPALRGFGSSKSAGVVPLFISFCCGVCMQFLLDHIVPHTHAFVEISEGPKSSLKPETMVMLAEIIHHIPEGIALGAVYAGHFMETAWISASTALILATAIAIQNFPEALFVCFPVREFSNKTGKAFLMGIISGIPVPLMGVAALIITLLFPASLPYIMSLAGGAMIFTIVEESPQMSSDRGNDKGALAFIAGFALVMLMIFSR